MTSWHFAKLPVQLLPVTQIFAARGDPDGTPASLRGAELDLPDERDQRIRELEERLALLSQASLRVNESLDFDTVLQGVLDSARSLTGARYGVIALHDEAGNAGDFLSSGMTADEAERVWQIPGWAEHFRYLAGLPVPLRVADLLGHIRSLGLPEMEPPLELSPRVSFLAAPVLHLGERVGSVFLAEKEGRTGVHAGGRGHAGDVRRPGGHGHRQRPSASGGAGGPGPGWRL